MTKTKINPRKEEREWKDLMNEKKAYIKRKQQEEDAERLLEEFQYHRDKDGPWEEDATTS